MGKGSLAIKVANWFFENENLVAVVPDMPEPTWTDSLAEWAKSKNVKVIESGHYKDISRKTYILIWQCLCFMARLLDIDSLKDVGIS